MHSRGLVRLAVGERVALVELLVRQARHVVLAGDV